MSVTNILKKTRELLGVENNEAVLPAIEALQQQPIIVTISWTPGQPLESASLNVLSGGQLPFHVLGNVLRAGQTVLDINAAQMIQQMGMRLEQAEKPKETTE